MGAHLTKSMTFKFPFFGDYSYAKNLKHWLISYRYTDDQKIVKRDWARHYFGLSYEIPFFYVKENNFLVCLKLINLSIWSIFDLNTLPRPIKGTQVIACFDMAGHTCPYPTEHNNLHSKIRDINRFLPKILMIKESCYLIGKEHFM